MTIPAVVPVVADYVAGLSPAHEDETVWGDGTMPLRLVTYLTNAPPPVEYVTSVRAVLLDEARVLVVRSQDDTCHLLPGGRREDGESLQETLLRELVEETGYMAECGPQIGVVHFHHLRKAPPGYRYPHPDFIWLVFKTRAVEHIGGTIEDDWEKESFWRPIKAADTLELSGRDLALLRAAQSVG